MPLLAPHRSRASRMEATTLVSTGFSYRFTVGAALVNSLPSM